MLGTLTTIAVPSTSKAGGHSSTTPIEPEEAVEIPDEEEAPEAPPPAVYVPRMSEVKQAPLPEEAEPLPIPETDALEEQVAVAAEQSTPLPPVTSLIVQMLLEDLLDPVRKVKQKESKGELEPDQIEELAEEVWEECAELFMSFHLRESNVGTDDKKFDRVLRDRSEHGEDRRDGRITPIRGWLLTEA